MKRILFLTLAVVLSVGLSGLSGCCGTRHAACGGSYMIDGSCGTCADCPETCQSCDCGDCGTCGQGCEYVQGYDDCGQGQGGKFQGLLSRLCPWGHRRDVAPAGDGAFGQGTGGVVAYPYYTTRGPRDFLAKNPRSIGP